MTPQLWPLKLVIFYLPILILSFLLYLPIRQVSCVQLEWLKSLNCEGSSFWGPKFCQIFFDICLHIL